MERRQKNKINNHNFFVFFFLHDLIMGPSLHVHTGLMCPYIQEVGMHQFQGGSQYIT